MILNYRQDNPRRPTAALHADHTSADVLAVLRQYAVDAFDFAEMDEQPRQFSRWDWHPRLRRTRNDPTINLFDHLTE